MTAAAGDESGGPEPGVTNGVESAAVTELCRLLAEERAAHEASAGREAALADILGLINASAGDPQPVFDAILEKAHDLCDATLGSLQVADGELFRAVATRGLDDEFADFLRRGYKSSGLFLSQEKSVQIPDTAELARETPDSPVLHAAAGRMRTLLLVPLIKDGKILGRLFAGRREVCLFTDEQIALLEGFAAQAVIAIETVRQFRTLNTRTRELEESLEYQTATSDVLESIASSATDTQPVFDTILDNALRLCGMDFGTIMLVDGSNVNVVTARKLGEDVLAEIDLQFPRPISRGHMAGRAILDCETMQIEDIRGDPDYELQGMATAGGWRTMMAVPLIKQGRAIGAISMAKSKVSLCNARQIRLVETFARQAVIAIENARLFEAEQERSRELQESLDYQTATSEVLGAIAQSATDPQTVFDAIVANAARLCDAQISSIYLLSEGGEIYPAALHNMPDGAEAFVTSDSMQEHRGSFLSRRAIDSRSVIEIRDILDDPTYPQDLAAAVGFRGIACVPLMSKDEAIGAIAVAIRAPGTFSREQIELLKSFASQAVIAMKNARLLSELRQRTEEVAELNRGLEARVAAQVEELGRVGRLKRFLAPQLAELIVSQGDEKILESHRREIVVVFCDLRGYTAFTETAEPEEVLDFLREYHGALGPLVAEYEGTLDQFSGDGIMVFFNDPVPIPDPAARAVKMAMAMRAAAGKLIADWRERGRELGFGVGIAQGYATLGQIGFSERAGYTAIGTVCNVAARLCAEAADDQILLSQRVNADLKGSIASEQVGALELKGLAQPVMAFNVPAARTQPTLRMIDGGDPQ